MTGVQTCALPIYGVDSDEGEDDFTPFKNIMNEYYAKDISKKRRIVNKMKGNAGIPLSPPPYALMNKAGGSAAFGRWASTHIHSRAGAQFATLLLGVRCV